MKLLTIATAMAGTLCFVASPAWAAWSPSAVLAHSADPQWVTSAVDAKGDAAIGWAVTQGTGTALYVATRHGAGGAWAERVLRSGRSLHVGGIALAEAPSGELTVAWVEQQGNGHHAVRTVYRTASGRWSTTQTVAYTAPFVYAYPRLAVSAMGTVSLAYNSATRAVPGMAVAWRTPGRAFGVPIAVPGGVLSEPALAIDAAGTTFLVGTARCDEESLSRGVLLTAPAATHRFRAPLTITPHPATEVRFVLTGTGSGVAAWLGAGCSTSELLSGPVETTRIDHARATSVVQISAGLDGDLRLLATSQRATLVWETYAPGNPGVVAMTATGGTDGRFSQPRAQADGWVPIASDAAGDELLVSAVARSTPTPQAVAVLVAGSPAAAASPIRGLSGPMTSWTGAGAITGHALVVATSISGALHVATWGP
jgi:hypothetical protein